MLVEFECPECKGHLYERRALNGSNLPIRLSYWHFILNPGMAFNELILGQRMPQETFVCKSCDLSLADRIYVHCPACGVFHPGRVWSYRNAFGNWLGYVCPSCGASIPCLWNLTSRLLLTLTAPIWFLPVKHYKTKWLGHQHRRIAQTKTNYIAKESGTPKPINYWLMGALFGVFMFIVFTLFFPLIFLIATNQFTVSNLFRSMTIAALSGLVVWPIAGLGFAFFVSLTMKKKGDEALHLTFESEEIVRSLPASNDEEPTSRDTNP